MNLYYPMDYDMGQAESAVKQALDEAQLPEGVNKPAVTRLTSSTFPILSYSLTEKNMKILAMGMTVVSYRLGELFQWAGHRSDWLKVLTGAAIIAAFTNIPLLGWIVLIIVMLISLGICTQWIEGKRKRKK